MNFEILYNGQIYLILIIFVMLISGMIKEYNLFTDLFYFFKKSTNSKKSIVALVSFISGLLPIPGRVTVSAGILDTIAPEKGCKGREKFGPIDYVSTHHYYLWSPLEKTVILPMAAFSLTYSQWFEIIWPLLLVSMIFVFSYLIFFVSESDIDLNFTDNQIKISKITRYIFPYIAAVVAMIAGVDFLWSFGLLALYYMFVTQTFQVKKLISYIDWKLISFVAFIIILSNFFLSYNDQIQNYLQESILNINNLTGFFLISLMAFGSSFLLGSSSRFAAITVLLTGIYGIQYLPWFFALDFAGYLLSPMHKCAAIGMLYFQTKFNHYASVLLVWSALVITLAFFMI